MKKFLCLLTCLVLVSACGSDKSASISSDEGGGSFVAQTDSVVPKADSVVSQMGKGKYREGELLVKFKSGVTASSSLRVHDAMGASAVKRYTAVPNLELVKLPQGLSIENAVVQYMSDPNVEYAEPNYLRKISSVIPNDTYFSNQWALLNKGQYAFGTAGADMMATDAWDLTVGSPNVIVAVIDTGLDYNHNDLAANVWRNQQECNGIQGQDDDGNGFIDDCLGWDFTTCVQFSDNGSCVSSKSRDNDPFDDNGHGTHVSGIIGAVGNNGNGISGVMWKANIMTLKALNANGHGLTSDIIDAVGYVVTVKNMGENIKAINASFGGGGFSFAEREIITAANTAGIIFVAAAGNGDSDGIGGNNDDSPHYPSSYDVPNIVSVAATDQDDIRVPFSNYGLNSVDVAAPGVYIFSTVPSWWNTFQGYGYLEFFAGTSMAAPHVTGLAGLLGSYYDGVQNTLFSHLQLHGTILRYVDKKPTLDGWIKSGGRINAYLALSSLLIPANLTAETAKGPLRVSLVWEDRATGEDGYKVERRSGGGDFAEIQTLPAGSSTFTDTSVSPHATYTYRVKAFNNIAESLRSNEVSVTVPGRRHSGGGGCSIGAPQNSVTAVADLIVMLIPFMLIAMLRRRK